VGVLKVMQVVRFRATNSAQIRSFVAKL